MILKKTGFLCLFLLSFPWQPLFSQEKSHATKYLTAIEQRMDSLEKFALEQKQLNEQQEQLLHQYKMEIISKDFTLTQKQDEILSLTHEVSQHKEYGESQALFLGIFIVITVLGLFSVIALITGVKEKKRILKNLEEKNNLINKQVLEIKQRNKEVTDSIKYARKIQEAILPTLQEIKSKLPDSFIYYRPKDIVSGDFYWLTEKNNKIYFVTADCTGHGVPGALMSMLGISYLNEIINKKNILDPAEILNELKREIIDSFSKNDLGEGRKDGMDIALYCLDKSNMKLTYSAANNGIYILRNKELIKLTPDKQPVGANPLQHQSFNQHEYELMKDDFIISYSDGFADQFGGPQGKKYKYKQLQELLLEVKNKPIHAIPGLLDGVFEKWKGQLEQVDDVLIVGVKV